jgi:signal transduction histidine kinase
MKIRFFFLAIFFLLGYSIGFSQKSSVIDSLKKQLVQSKSDTRRVNILVDLCSQYRQGNTDSSVQYGLMALDLAKSLQDVQGQIEAQGFLSITEEQLGNLSQAFQMAFTSLEMAKENHLEKFAGPAYNALGETCIILKDYNRALSYLKKEKSIAMEQGSLESLAYSHYDLGVAYTGLNILDSAQTSENEATKYFKALKRDEPLVLLALGDIELKKKNLNEALNFYLNSLKISIPNGEHRATAYAYNKLAYYYYGQNNIPSSTDYALKCIDESRIVSQRNTLLESASLLSQIYEPTNPSQSLYYLKIADTYKSWLFGASNIQTIQSVINQEVENQRKAESDKIAYRNRVIQWAFIGGLLVMLLIALILYRNARQKQKTNALLESTLKDLQSRQSQLIQSEKMASLWELTAGIAHEIQNPLNFVNNFSDLNQELLAEMLEEIRKGNFDEVEPLALDITQNEAKIQNNGKRADAIIKGMLQHSQRGDGKKESIDLNALADEYLRLAYHGLRAKDKDFNVFLKTDLEPGLGKVNIIPQDIGRVLLNLYNNAFYSVHQKKKISGDGFEPLVSVITRKGNNQVFIHVQDNGLGVPAKIIDKIFQPFYTTKPTGQGTGLGLSLSYDMVKAHGGEILVESREGHSCEFIVRFPA